ncbi:MAG: protein kinase [Myxococcota bacterium]
MRHSRRARVSTSDEDRNADAPQRRRRGASTTVGAAARRKTRQTVQARPAKLRGQTEQDEGEDDEYTEIGRFKVQHKIASGGMGVVFAAKDEQLDRILAVKVLHTRENRNEEAYGRMMREARAMARLSHPNVVQVHEVGEVDGKVFVAMEYVQGLTLRKWLKAERRSWRDVLEIFRQAGQGLMAAHSAGIVHRDFKPDNVIVSKDYRVKVLDFGLARWHDPSDPTYFDESTSIDGEEPVSRSGPHEATYMGEGGSLTRTGFVMGTPAYMSPEQHKGFPADARSDQFSFCVALYEALYGRRPFPGRSFQQVARTITEEAPLPRPTDSRVPKWLHRVVMRGLSRNPAQRFPSMEALLSGFEDFQAKVDARNANMLRLETGLGSMLVGLFWILDWLFVREHIVLTGLLRGTVIAYALGIYVLCRQRPRLVERYVDPLAFSVNLAAGWSIAAIVWLEGGLESPYYAGLNLLVLSVGIMFLWTLRTALLLNGLLYVFYMLPLVIGVIEPREPGVILMNQFFLVSTIIITLAAQHQRFALQRREFIAEQERSQLREEVAAMARGGQRPELHDRSQFLLLAEDEFQRSRRFGRPMACMVMGIDGFTEVNEQYDPSVGKELLEYVSQRIVKDIRQFDLVGKYHADEFVFLLPETEIKNAREVAERLIDKLSHTTVSTRAGMVEITLSLGLSELTPETSDLALLLARAIAALEQAKLEGGARSVMWRGEYRMSRREAESDSGGQRRGRRKSRADGDRRGRAASEDPRASDADGRRKQASGRRSESGERCADKASAPSPRSSSTAS